MSASPLPEARGHDRAVFHSSSRYAGWTAGQRRAERQRLLDAALERARREAATAGLTMVCEVGNCTRCRGEAELGAGCLHECHDPVEASDG